MAEADGIEVAHLRRRASRSWWRIRVEAQSERLPLKMPRNSRRRSQSLRAGQAAVGRCSSPPKATGRRWYGFPSDQNQHLPTRGAAQEAPPAVDIGMGNGALDGLLAPNPAFGISTFKVPGAIMHVRGALN
jgi:hypothetical protein